jgi:serine/threonine protein kinase
MIEKKLLKEEEITEQFIRELKIQMYLNHPNIIKLYGFFDDEHYIYIILEVGTGGQLYHQLRKSEPMAENRVAPIMKQVCEAVNEIHSLRIIHRDIKPENIVIHDVTSIICRTSSSCAISGGQSTWTTN